MIQFAPIKMPILIASVCVISDANTFKYFHCLILSKFGMEGGGGGGCNFLFVNKQLCPGIHFWVFYPAIVTTNSFNNDTFNHHCQFSSFSIQSFQVECCVSSRQLQLLYQVLLYEGTLAAIIQHCISQHFLLDILPMLDLN